MKYKYEKIRVTMQKSAFSFLTAVFPAVCVKVLWSALYREEEGGGQVHFLLPMSLYYFYVYFFPLLSVVAITLPPFSTMLGFTQSHTHCAWSFNIACHLWQIWDYSVLPQPGNTDTVVWKHRYSGV